MMVELTTCNGKKLLVNPNYLLTVLEADNGHSHLVLAEYNHSIEVTQSVKTIENLLLL